MEAKNARRGPRNADAQHSKPWAWADEPRLQLIKRGPHLRAHNETRTRKEGDPFFPAENGLLGEIFWHKQLSKEKTKKKKEKRGVVVQEKTGEELKRQSQGSSCDGLRALRARQVKATRSSPASSVVAVCLPLSLLGSLHRVSPPSKTRFGGTGIRGVALAHSSPCTPAHLHTCTPAHMRRTSS